MPKRKEYLKGQQVGSLIFLEEREPKYYGNQPFPSRTALFKCSCGTEFETLIGSVSQGLTKTCGCSKAKNGKAKEIQYEPDQKVGEFIFIKELAHYVQPGGKKKRQALFRCKCSKEVILIITEATSGHRTTCGCGTVERAKKLCAARITHGFSKTPEYASWKNMFDRCTNAENKAYKDYGGRGITVCDRWLSFENFLEDMGCMPQRGYSIERVEVDGNYEKSNCIWIPRGLQNRNKRSNRMIEWKGETRCLNEWAEILQIDRTTLRDRLNDGWDIERAFTTPVRKMKKAA